MAGKTQPYAENGVIIDKLPAYAGDEVTITYDGLLAKSGADKVYAYIGYGEEWQEKGFVPMNLELDTFKATFKALMPGTMYIAFKDSAENWDNNSGANYSFEIGKKKRAAVKTSEKKTEEKKAPENKAAQKKPVAKAAAVKKTEDTITEAVPKKKAVRKKKEEA
ncbi:MAG: carbohydrate-binding protein [Clostridia bacterium]|nr:carbohydrate-binding protein [Clostridia bacterium]